MLLQQRALHALLAAYGDALACVLVYIEEAHAADEWPISSARSAPRGVPVALRVHRSDDEREAAARALLEDFDVPLSVLCATDSLQRGWACASAEDVAWEAGGAKAAASSAAAPVVSFENAYAAWPLRWLIVEEGKGGGAWVCTRVGRPVGPAFLLEDCERAVGEVVSSRRRRSSA